MTQYYNTQPEALEEIRSVGITTTIIRMDIRELTPEDIAAIPEGSVPVGLADGEPSTIFAAEEIEYNHREPMTSGKDRSALITAIVRARYNADAMEALVNNYLLDPDAYREEMAAMQTWRQRAKDTADEVRPVE